MSVSFPGESPDYRAARNALLQEEIELRKMTETVAARRRQLPEGGPVPADYTFRSSADEPVRMSELFQSPSNTLAIYSLMFRPDQSSPCPMCTSMLDGLDGQAGHIGQQMDLVIVAAANADQLQALAASRGWRNLRLYSAGNSGYQSDYHGQAEDGSQLPMMNVFRRTRDGIRHFWGSELFFAGLEGQPRHVDQLWPLWNMLDLTPAGRGTDWYPALAYGSQM